MDEHRGLRDYAQVAVVALAFERRGECRHSEKLVGKTFQGEGTA